MIPLNTMKNIYFANPKWNRLRTILQKIQELRNFFGEQSRDVATESFFMEVEFLCFHLLIYGHSKLSKCIQTL